MRDINVPVNTNRTNNQWTLKEIYFVKQVLTENQSTLQTIHLAKIKINSQMWKAYLSCIYMIKDL